MAKPIIECSFSPALLHLYDFTKSKVVIIDIFRATSTIAAALDKGAKAIIPVDEVQKAIDLKSQIENSITAGERNGQIAEGLEFGNSPNAFEREFIQGKNLILTTTNGTRLLHQTINSEEIISGSFLNLNATAQYLIDQKSNVLLACASWKDRFNLEDTLFAGAVYEKVKEYYQTDCDSIRAAHTLYLAAKDDLFTYLTNSSHYNRLSKLGLIEDLKYCCQVDKHDNLIRYKNEQLTIG